MDLKKKEKSIKNSAKVNSWHIFSGDEMALIPSWTEPRQTTSDVACLPDSDHWTTKQ